MESVRPSSTKSPLASAVEAKQPSAFAGNQLKNGTNFLRDAGFKRVDSFTGNLGEFLKFLGK